MAGFGEDVSMGEFDPPQAENGASNAGDEAGVGHTSDGSVLNVQVPTPRSDTAAGAGISVGGVASDGGFGAGAPPTRTSKVIQYPCHSVLRTSRGTSVARPKKGIAPVQAKGFRKVKTCSA